MATSEEKAAEKLPPCPICGGAMVCEFIRGKGFGYRCRKDGIFTWDYIRGDKHGYTRAKKELDQIRELCLSVRVAHKQPNSVITIAEDAMAYYILHDILHDIQTKKKEATQK